jgi:ketosteroid isomerase-like protein
MIRSASLLLAGALLAVAPTFAADQATRHGNPAVIAQAETYLAAYAQLDLAALERLYADDAAFSDPTSQTVAGIGGPFVWRGRAEILAGIGRWKQTVTSLAYDVERIYESSNHVVFVGEVRPLVAGPNGPTQYAYPIVTVITIANGKVAEHRDYTNYAAGRTVPPREP